MIAIDTNALIRMLIEDEAAQAKAVQDVLIFCETHSMPVLVLTEVLIEAVWVLNLYTAAIDTRYRSFWRR